MTRRSQCGESSLSSSPHFQLTRLLEGKTTTLPVCCFQQMAPIAHKVRTWTFDVILSFLYQESTGSATSHDSQNALKLSSSLQKSLRGPFCYHHHHYAGKLRLRPKAWVPHGKGGQWPPLSLVLSSFGVPPQDPLLDWLRNSHFSLGAAVSKGHWGWARSQAKNIKGNDHLIPHSGLELPFPGPHVTACPSEEWNFAEKIHSAQDNILYFLFLLLGSFFLHCAELQPLRASTLRCKSYPPEPQGTSVFPLSHEASDNSPCSPMFFSYLD